MPSTQCKYALDFTAHMDAREYTLLADLLSDDFTHRFFPASLNGMGMPFRTKRQFLDHVKELESVIERFNFQPPKEIIEGKNVVVLHLIADGRTASGKPYNNEYMFTFRFKDEKIISIKEFMDSKYVTQMLEEEKPTILAR